MSVTTGQAVIAERARSKINLTLRVLGRRADGYHLLESLIAFADVGDEVRFAPGTPRSVSMTGSYAGAILAGAALCLVSFVITLMTPEPARWLAGRKPAP